ncbi:MAG: hypothetical protein PVH40_07120 [Gemmatimonadales bacterium]
MLTDLRHAQAEFERVRIRHLPRTLGGSRAKPDATFGRLQYWDEEEGKVRTRPPDPQPVVEARDAFLTRLDSAARVLPADAWITGQRVRYLVDAGRLEAARQAAADCQADAWWCAALSGFVAHLRSDFAVSDSSFSISLSRMSDEQRCEWTDLTETLGGDLATRYRETPCRDRDRLNARIFWLADPLYLLPGNDRRTEHYARHVVHELFDGTITPQGLVWGEDNFAMSRRYGWSEVWERTEYPRAASPHVVGHQRRRGEHFMPPSGFVDAPHTIGWDDWDLDGDRPRERYAPRYANEFSDLDAQVASFRRPQGAVVVTAFEVPRTPGESDQPPGETEVALIASRDAASGTLAQFDTLRSSSARLALRLPLTPVLLSIEALNPEQRHAARRRFWLDTLTLLSDGFGVSDLLLVRGGADPPHTLDEALPIARTSASFTRGDSIGVYWEMYGPSLGAPRSVSLVVVKEDRGFFRRAIEWIGLAEKDKPTVRLKWMDAPELLRGPGRHVTVGLPPGQQGRFTIRLEVTRANGTHVAAERAIVVRDDG